MFFHQVGVEALGFGRVFGGVLLEDGRGLNVKKLWVLLSLGPFPKSLKGSEYSFRKLGLFPVARPIH